MQAEAATLRKVLDYKITFYDHAHHQELWTPGVAQMLSNTLYGKRFFPFYTFNVCGGVDAQGCGKVYGYDAIGSFESVPYVVTGSGSALITSLLDNQVAFKTQPGNKKALSIEETVDLVKDCFTCAGERDIYTGDAVHIAVITSAGVDMITDKEPFLLKKD
jgi:20S proteasome subunit beta 6